MSLLVTFAHRTLWQVQIITAILIAGVFAFLTGATAASAAEPVAEIPFRYDYDGWITVPVSINGEGPYDFIIDSGATITVVFQNLADLQNFPLMDGEPKRILGLIEASDLLPRYIGRIEAGGASLDQVVSVVVADWPAERPTPQGVLGLDFLARYIVEIDPAEMVIRLFEDGVPEKAKSRKWSRSDLNARTFSESAKPLYTVNIRVESKRYPFILDLGASGTIINYPLLERLFRAIGVNVNDPEKPELHDLFGNQSQARLIEVKLLRLGRARWRNKIISVFNAAVFDELGVSDEPFGLLGADLLRGRALVLDFPDGKIYLGPTVH